MCQWNIICFYSVGLYVQHLCQLACSPRVTGVVSLPSDGSPQFLAYECLCYYFADRVPVYVVSVNNADSSVPTAAFHDGRSRWWGRFFLCHSQVNGAKVVRCDDNSNNVIVVRATRCIVGHPAMVVSPSGSLSALPTVGPTMNLAGSQPFLSGQQYSVSALFNHVIVIFLDSYYTQRNNQRSGGWPQIYIIQICEDYFVGIILY